jgi:uncharacterized repeat protein (TIGR01451 family)
VNGDGRAYLVVANFNSNSSSVSVLLGNGNGTFAAQQTFATGSRPYSVAVSDVNGDGKPDLVVANQNSNSVSVLLGNGNGTFAVQQTFATGATPASVAVSDVNGDGKADLVVVNASSSSVSVLLGDPQPVVKSINRTTPPGSIDSASSVTYTVTFSEVVTGVDFTDFSLALSGITATSPVVVAGSGAVYTVTINGLSGTGTLGLNLVNNGSIQDSLGSPLALYGTFQAQQTYFAGPGPRWITTADVNGDGKQDLILAAVNTLGVTLGNGNGTFQPEQILPIGPGGINPFFVVAADVNGDGKADLIVANSSGATPNIGVLLGNGNGTFQFMTTFATGSNSNPVSIAVGDVNRDGKPDLVVANFNNNNVGVLLGNGNGTFAAEQTFSTGAGSDPTSVSLADVNGDGKLDAIVSDGGTEKLGVLLGNGNGTFQTQQTLSTGTVQPNSVQAADVNADGRVDLIFAGNNSVGVFLGNGNGTFLSPQTFSTLSSVGVPALSISVAVADVNGDGKPDLVVVNSYAQANTVGILLGNGNGTFQAQQTYATGVKPQSVALADVNGDGRVDLLVANSTSNSVSELLADSTGNFTGQIYNVTIGANLSLAVSAPGTIAAQASASYAYTLVVTNLGPSDNTGGFTLTDTLSAGVTFQSGGSTAGAVASGQTITYTSAGLTNLSAQTYVIAVTAPAMANGTVVQNSATVATLGTPDPVSANNTVITTTTSEIPAGFSGQLTFSTANGNPRSIAVADLNGDGKADLVTADIATSAVSVLLGNGDGTFQAQQTYAAGGNSTFVAVADLNEDGKPDLIVANEFSNTLSVLLGNGNGTFQAQVTFATGSTPISVAVADVNGDGKLDLIVANHGSNNVGVLLGNGNGTFAPQQTFDTGISSIPSSVTVADVNGDGRPDLVVANEITYSVGVLLGNGNGTFGPQQTVSTGNGSRPFFVTVADVNGDGKGDVIVANYLSSTVGVLLGNGNGTFAAQQTFSSGANSNPGTIAVSDVNGDGKEDLVVSNTGANTVGVWLGNGNGTFEAPQTFSTGAGSVPRAVAVSDVNGDGRGDLLVAFAAGVDVFLGDPPPVVQSINRTTPAGPVTSAGSVTYTVTFSKPVTGVDATDFTLALNGVTATTPVVVAGGGAVYTVTINGISGAGMLGLNLVNDGSIQDSLNIPLGPIGTFQTQQTFATGSFARSVAVADLNGDGKGDLVSVNYSSNSVSVLLSNGNGTVAAQQTFATGTNPVSVVVSDVNGDGKADLLVVNEGGNSVSVLLGNGNGTFAAQQTFATGAQPLSVAVADVNGDGKADLIVANQSRASTSVSVLLGNGNGTFATQQTFATGVLPTSVAVSDVNRDGKPDLIVANEADGSVSVLLGNGNGTFAAQQTFATGVNPFSVAASDVNGDGIPDLVVANEGSNSASVLLGNGNGTFAAQQTFATGDEPLSVVVSDVNGDGKADLIVANNADDSVSVLLGNGNGSFAAEQTFASGEGPSSVAVSDLNGDGKADLVVANFSNSVSVLLADPSGNFTGPTYTIDHPPTITSNGGGETASISIPEFTTAVTTVTATDPDAGQTLTYNITGGDDAAKFQISSGGVLSFITPPDFNNPTDVGADNVYNVIVQVSDGAGGTDSQAIAVTVQYVNQPPAFTPGANVTVNEDSGAVTIPGWATGISAGTDESGQTLTFSVTGITPAVSAMGPVWTGYAGGPQHEAISSIASQPLDAIRWSTPVDLNPQFDGNDLYIHYGTPLITQANTVIVPVKTGASDGFEVEALNGSNGSMIWSQTTDYTLPPHDEWTPSYSPALVGTRMYFAGAGGTVYYRDSVDSATASGSGQIAFYGTANYTANPTAYNSSIHISTPITADAAGNIYFGFQADGSNPLGITDGFARIAPDGSATYTSAATASGGAFNHALTNAAPALSKDGQHLYVVVSTGFGFGTGELLELNSATLAPQASAALKDPSSGQNALLPDDGTASPMVGPDGDVYFGVLENPFPANHDRGWMLHFSGDLSQVKTPGAFGWDDTASVVPASMVPSYHGTSSYLIMTKYNNYADPGLGGDGVNKIAILDPNATETDPITGATVMNEVLTIAGVTPDTEFLADDPNAVREWCINTAVVDPATDSILANSEDGKLYRWDLATNSFSQVITLTPGVGEAYTPTLIGADGTVYAINDATLFAIGYSQQDLNSGLFSVPPSVDPATGNLTFTPAPDAFGTSQITLSLMDNGGTANGGIDTTTHTFSITVQPVNDAPTLDAIADPAPVLENSGQQTISLGGITAGPANERTQSLTVTATSNNHALVADPTVIYTSSDLNGTLSFTPVPGAFGSAMITVTVQDSGGTANGGVDTFTRTFDVVVSPAAAISATVTSAATAVPGQSAQFVITISNDGQTNATGVSVADIIPAGFLGAMYIATDNGLGATGYTASGSGSIGDTVNLPAGAQITYALNGMVSASATGAMTDTVTAATAAGVTNTEANVPAISTTNQGSANVTLTPTADIYVSIASSGPVTIGGNVIYTIIVTNNGPSDLNGATLTDTFSNLTGVSFTSTSLYSVNNPNFVASTPTVSPASGVLAGEGPTLNETLNMSSGSVLQFTVTGTVAADAPATLTNTVTVADPAGTSDANSGNNTATVNAAVNATGGSVVSRSLFYLDSFFDGNNTGAPKTADFAGGPNGTGALALDKIPLLPGQTATYANVSNFQDGIDGIFIDMTGVPNPAAITAADFEFNVGNSSTPGTGSAPGAGWSTLATAPTVTLFAGQGVGGSDRFALSWPAGTISGEWLQVTVKGNTSPNPDTNTGLATPDVFYFGSAPGDSGNSTADFDVDAIDETNVRNDPHNFLNHAPITNPNDFTRDADVDSSDNTFARNHTTNFINALKVITVPGLPNGQGVMAPAASGATGSKTVPDSPLLSLAATSTNTATIAPIAIDDDGDSAEKKPKVASTSAGRAGVYVVKLSAKPKPAGKSASRYHISTGLPSGKTAARQRAIDHDQH